MAQTIYDQTLEDLPASPSTIYDDLLEERRAGQETRLRRSLRIAEDTPPDRAAETRRMSLKFGVPPAIVDREFDDYSRRDRLARPYGDMQRETPGLTTWLEDPQNAAVAQDDLENLGLLEWLVTAPQRAYRQGAAQVAFGQLRNAELFRDLSATERERLEALRADMEAGGALGAGRSWFRQAVTGAASQLPILFGATIGGLRVGIPAGATMGTAAAILGQAGPQVGIPEEIVTVPAAFAGGLTYGTAAGAAQFGFQLESGLAFDEFLDFKDELGQPIDRDAAKAAALAAGALNAGLEAAGVGIFLKTIPGADKLTGAFTRSAIRQALRVPTVRAALAEAVKVYGGALAGETAVEVAQRSITILAGELGKVASGQNIPARTPTEVAQDLYHEAVGAAQAFALLSLPGPLAGAAIESRRARQAAQNVGFFEALGEGAAQSKTIQRQPEAARAFLEEVTKDGPIATVYAPADTWTTYWQQQGVDPFEAAAELTGDAEALERAQRTGADLAIPTSRYATKLAGTEHNAFFAEELRLGPGEMNGREARTFREEQEARAEQQQAEGAAPPAPADRVADRIRQVLESSAGVPRGTAEGYARLWGSVFGTLGQRVGVDPETLFERYGVRVERPNLGTSPPDDFGGGPAPGGPAPGAGGAAPGGAGTPAPAGGADLLAEIPGFAELAEGVAGASLTEAPTGPTEVGGSGESGASLEALSRQAGMAARGESFVVYDRAGQRRPLVGPEAVDYVPQAGETYGIETPEGFTVLEDRGGRLPRRVESRPSDVDQPQAGDLDPGDRGERGRPDAVGGAEGPGDGAGTQSRRLPSSADESVADGERYPAGFERATAEADAARLVPEVTRELERISEELHEFPYEARTWHWIAPEDRAWGNAAGGHAQVTAGHAGAPVYDDIQQFAPLSKGSGGRPAQRVRGDRGAVLAAIVKMLETGRIHNNLAEGAVRVAERRAANDYRELSRPLIAPAWGVEVDRAFTDAVSTAIGETLEAQGLSAADLEAQGGDPTFDPTEYDQGLFDDAEADPAGGTADVLGTGEVQPRLPGAESVRDTENATPELEAPFALTPPAGEVGRRGKQTTLFQSAFHGSPHVFERFSLHAIGSGEGAQAYGWGLYFASNREVADEYRKRLAGESAAGLVFDGLRVWDTEIGLYYVKWRREGGTWIATSEKQDAETQRGLLELNARLYWSSVATTRTMLEKSIANVEEAHAKGQTFSGDKDRDLYNLEEYRAALRVVEQYGDFLRYDKQKPGRTYTVEIPEDEDFLDWDKPASQQSPKVQAALKALGLEWTPLKVPTLDAAVRFFQSAKAANLAAEDIGIRESLQEGYRYAITGATTAFAQWYYRHGGLLHERGAIDPTGEDLYAQARQVAEERHRAEHGKGPVYTPPAWGESARMASELLASEGLAGIRYLDGFSRSKGEGSSNFVVFDDKLVQIVEFDQAAGRGRYKPAGQEIDALNEELDAVTQTIRDMAPAGSRLEAFITQNGELFVDSIAVQQSQQGQGAGSEMMRRLLAWADERNLQIALDAAPSPGKKSALDRFYKRLGFVRNGSRWFYDPASAGSLVRPALSERVREQKQDRRGSISFGPNRQVTINLFERADLSTFIHESGHLFLEVLSDLGNEVAGVAVEARTEEQQQILADLATLKDWLADEDHRGRGWSTKQHEQFARGFEAYLMEGRAPAIGLVEVFARVRAWLVGIYKQLRALDVELSDEVRAVFDRLVASDQAINDAEAAGRVTPLFSSRPADMSPEQWDLYRAHVSRASQQAREALDRRLLSEVQREQETQWKERRDAIRTEVARQAHESPVYRALAAMQRGTHPDGAPLVAEPLESPALKLSKRLIVERYGADRLRVLPRPYVYSAEGGLDPDVVAEMFGFDSGDHMLRELAGVLPMQRAIEQETDRRMIAEHGSLLLDGTIHEQARAAVANEERDAVIRAELRALNQLRRTVEPFVEQARAEGAAALGAERRERAYERRWLEAESKLRIAIAEGRKQEEIDALEAEVRNLRQKARGGPATIRAGIPPASVLRDVARARVRGTRIRALVPETFWSAARRASERATEAAARQDFEAAIVAKQEELLNVALYRESVRALEDVQARIKKARDLGKPAARARLAQAGDSYLDQVDGILDRYEFAPVPRQTLDRRARIERWVAALEGDGIPVDLPDEVLNDARRINYREITVEELIGITDGLEQILHLARLKNRLLKHAEARELEAEATAIAASVRAHTNRRVREGARDRRPAEERARLVSSFFGSHRKMSSLVREMDGFVEGGPMWEAVVRPINEAGNREADMFAAATRALSALIETAFPGAAKRALYTKRRIDAIGKSLSRMERIMVALNWGNEGNRDRIRRAEGWTDQQVAAILATLDARDLTFVEGVWSFLESYWPEIAAKQKRVTGLEPEKVEATPFTVGGRQMRGGYFPLKADERLSAGAAAKLDLEAANLAKQAAFVSATTRRGHTIARVKRQGREKTRLDFGVIFEHVSQVIHDLSHHETLIDVGRILGHREVQKAILDTYGDQVYREIRDTVRDVAFGDVPATSAFERLLTHARIGTTIVGLGWNFVTSALQPLGLFNSIERVGAKWVARGVGRWMRDTVHMESTIAFVHDRSLFMRNRGRTQQREINEVRNAVGVDTGRLSGWIDATLQGVSGGRVRRQAIADSYFFLIQRMQMLADVPTWLGAYEKALAGGEAEGRAVALADQAVLDSQGGGQTKDLARVQRGGPALKLWTNFYSFFNVVYNQAAEAGHRTRFTRPAEVGRLAVDYVLLFIAPATLGYMLREALRPRTDDDEGLAEGLIRENVAYIFGTLMGLRELSGVVQGFYGYEGPAGSRAFASAGRLAQQTGQVIEEGEDAIDEAFVRSVAESAGIWFHFPATQTWRTLAGISALAEGETQNPAAVVSGPPRGR